MDLFDYGKDSIGNRMNFLMLGDTKTGKTSLMNSYTGIEIGIDALGKPPKTIGVNTFVKKIAVGKSTILAHIYDFSGDKDHLKHLSVFLRMLIFRSRNHYGKYPIHGIFVTFDVNNKNSLYGIKSWLRWCSQSLKNLLIEKEEIEETHALDLDDFLANIPVFILGNKVDKLKVGMDFSLNQQEELNHSQEKIEKFINGITNHLRKTFGMAFFENLILVSKDDKEDLEEVFRKFITATFEKDLSPSFREVDFDVKNYSLNKYSVGFFLRFKKNTFLSSIFSFWKKDDDNTALPL